MYFIEGSNSNRGQKYFSGGQKYSSGVSKFAKQLLVANNVLIPFLDVDKLIRMQ